MKILVTCKICGSKLTEANKLHVTQTDLDLYEQTTSCDIDGPNTYEYDEDGNLLSSNVHVIATKVLE